MNVQKLVIIQHNVQSWNSNKITLSNIYNTIDPDIILINDHSLIDNQALKVFNYNTFYSNKQNELHAGTAIAVKRHISIKLHDNFHSDMLAITIGTQQGPITIGTTYTPPRIDYLNYIDFHTLFNRPHPVYFLGDINARHKTIGSSNNNNRGKHLHTLITRHKCRHIGPHFPTLITHNSTTSPDIVLQNTHAYHNIHLRPGPITPSDHIPIIATISANPIQIPIRPRKQHHKADWNKYKQILSIVTPPTQQDPTLEEIDEQLNSWTEYVKQASNETIPTLTYRIIPGIKPSHETLTLQAQYQHTLQYIYHNGPSIQLNRHLLSLRNQLQNYYITQYGKNWDRLIQSLHTQENTKAFWSSVKRMMGSNTKQQIPYLEHNNTQLHTPQEKEPIFRQHWQQIFTEQEHEQFDLEHINTIQEYMNNLAPQITPHHTGNIDRLNQLHFPPITIEEFIHTLKTFKQKAPGPTGITTLQLKNLPKNMIHFLIYIFNMSISAGYFPDSLKHATMIFLPKPNTSQKQVQNYRPISLLDIHGKILDKILNNRLTNYLTIHDHFNIRQHGFRRDRGTHTALATLHETLSIATAQKHTIDIVLRDVSKAFDKVWHSGLIYKLSRTNIHPIFLRTLNDYLTDRTASIRIGSHIGPPFTLHTGVPQGACLSPTLYSFYTHDIPEPLPNTDYICFADDITQITHGKYTPQYAAKQTEHAIQQINTFENKWKILTNTNKFKIIPVSRRKTSDIYIEDQYFPYTSHGTVLGLKFSTNGFSSQITSRQAIAYKNLNKLYRFTHLSLTTKLKLYLAFVRSALLYPVIPLHTLSPTAISKLQRVQNKALRFITNTHILERVTSKTLHEQVNIPPINILLHEQAHNIWSKMFLIDLEQYNKLTFPLEHINKQHSQFKSSRIHALAPPPLPKYN
jgi:hypothetical protein